MIQNTVYLIREVQTKGYDGLKGEALLFYLLIHFSFISYIFLLGRDRGNISE